MPPFNVISRRSTPEIVLSSKRKSKFCKQVGKLNYCRYCEEEEKNDKKVNMKGGLGRIKKIERAIARLELSHLVVSPCNGNHFSRTFPFHSDSMRIP